MSRSAKDRAAFTKSSKWNKFRKWLKKERQIDELYNSGVLAFARSDYEGAIEIWTEVLKIDSRFDPAIEGIKSAQNMIDMFQKIRDSMFLEQ